VFLGRRPEEQIDTQLYAFYTGLLHAIDDPVFKGGDWDLCERTGWPDNRSFENIVAWAWKKNGDRYLIVVNLSDQQSQGLVKITDHTLQGSHCRLVDALSSGTYYRSGDEMIEQGLYVDLPPWGYHFFRFHA